MPPLQQRHVVSADAGAFLQLGQILDIGYYNRTGLCTMLYVMSCLCVLLYKNQFQLKNTRNTICIRVIIYNEYKLHKNTKILNNSNNNVLLVF